MDTVLTTARKMWLAATNHLLYNDPLDLDLEELDDVVDDQERTIRRLVHDHVGTNPRRDLDLSLMIVSVVQDGERIGDLSTSIGGLADLADSPLIGRHTHILRSLRDRISSMFDDTRAGFIDGDSAAAERVMASNRQIKPEMKGFVAELSESDETSVNEAVILANAALMMGRVSSHLSNIASTVVLPFEQIRGSGPDQSQG